MALLRFERHKEAVIAAKESVKQCPGQARTFLLIAHATSRYPEESSKLRERAKVRFTILVRFSRFDKLDYLFHGGLFKN